MDLQKTTRRIRIYITQKDIDEGVAHSTRSCPIARAINRRLNKNSRCKVWTKTILIDERVVMEQFLYTNERNGRSVYQFMNAFDTHKEVKPFSFLLDVPVEFLKK